VGEGTRPEMEARRLERKNSPNRASLWRGQLVSPKTAASTRDILLGSALGETLRIHRENSSHRGPDDFVFAKRTGRRWTRTCFGRTPSTNSGQARDSEKKGASGFHTFRHSAASIVTSRPGNLKLAQKFLGHSTIR